MVENSWPGSDREENQDGLAVAGYLALGNEFPRTASKLVLGIRQRAADRVRTRTGVD